MQPRTFRFVLAYEGTGFWGFARQPDRRTIEGTLWQALQPMLPDLRKIVVGGRTDRGVHATGQVISLRTRCPVDSDRLGRCIDRAAPGEIACLHAERTRHGFHAQFWARSRSYTYLHPAERDAPRAGRLERLLQALVGTRDFFAFARDTPKGRSTVRRLEWVRVRSVLHDGRPHLRFDLIGRSFLRHQVRVMVATALREAAAPEPSDDALLRLAETHDRTATEPPAPPGHLHLVKIVY
jgi:tRNA pseudouridine38-40 synthase